MFCFNKFVFLKMNHHLFVGALQSCLQAKSGLRNQIVEIPTKFRRQRRKNRQALLIRNVLLSYLQISLDTSLGNESLQFAYLPRANIGGKRLPCIISVRHAN